VSIFSPLEFTFGISPCSCAMGKRVFTFLLYCFGSIFLVRVFLFKIFLYNLSNSLSFEIALVNSVLNLLRGFEKSGLPSNVFNISFSFLSRYSIDISYGVFQAFKSFKRSVFS